MVYYTDKYIQASALQKSIRRGNKEAAYSAANWFLENGETTYLLRRLSVILLEDVGIAGIDIACNYLASSTAERKARLFETIAEMCAVPKDRNACNLSLIAEHSLELKRQREIYVHLSDDELKKIIMDEETNIDNRVIASWIMCGTLLYPSYKIKSYRDGFPAWIRWLADMGIPEDVRLAIELFTRQRVDNMTAALPFSYSMSRQFEQSIKDIDIVNPVMLGDIPAAALDQHTRCGKASIYEWVFSTPIFDALVEKVPSPKMATYGGWALFHIEGASVAKQLTYDGCNDPLFDATAAFLVTERFTDTDLEKLLAVAKENLPALNEIRARKLEQLSKAPQQLEFPK